jgi:hypothetical protein
MSFIDKFLDLTTPLHREIVRFLKLYKVVEERSKELNTKLKKQRDIYLQKLREKEKDNNNDILSIKNEIDNLFKEILNLSNYKQEILKELKYIFEYSFLNKIKSIIEEGQKECQEQLLSNNNMSTYGTNSFANPYSNKMNDDMKSMSEFNDKKKKGDISFLEKKKKRPTSLIANKRRNPGIGEHSDELSLHNGENEKVYCTCQGPCYGKMIECEKCKEWFHLRCVGIEEGQEPDDNDCWFCKKCSSENKNKKLEKPKKKKKAHN